MTRFILIIFLFASSSCSVFRHKTENSSRQTDRTVHAVQRRDSLQLSMQARRIRFLSDDRLELTEIIPEGKFVYRPDSGFEGKAKSLRVYRQTRQRSLEKDTSSLRLAAGRDSLGVDSTLHEQVRQQLEETEKAKPVSVWMYVLAAAILLFVGRFVGKKPGEN